MPTVTVVTPDPTDSTQAPGDCDADADDTLDSDTDGNHSDADDGDIEDFTCLTNGERDAMFHPSIDGFKQSILVPEIHHGAETLGRPQGKSKVIREKWEAVVTVHDLVSAARESRISRAGHGNVKNTLSAALDGAVHSSMCIRHGSTAAVL